MTMHCRSRQTFWPFTRNDTPRRDQMSKVSMSTELPVAIDQVWRLIGGFNALPDWHPAVQKSELQEGGRVRQLLLANGASLVERLEAFNENERTYTYSIQQGPLPVLNYKATI